MSAWLKAGLIGAAVVGVLNLLGLIPCVGVVACGLAILSYAGIGALAAYYMPPMRDTGRAAGFGALAALIAGLVGGLVNMVVVFVQSSSLDSAQILSQIPAEMLQQLEASGADMSILDTFAGPVGALIGGSICCVGSLILAAILGAVGGAVFAAIKAD